MSGVIAFGDLQVGATLSYGRTPEERLDEQEQVLHRVVDTALERAVDLVLIGGDIWERRRPTPAEMLAVARPMRRLRAESACEIVTIVGNHDVESHAWPTAIEVFGDLMGVHRTPAVVQTRACDVVVLPWTPPGPLVARLGSGDRGHVYEVASDLLLRIAEDLRRQTRPGLPALLVGHWAVDRAVTASGLPVGRMSEVMLPLDQLETLGFDAVVLSHIHKMQLLATSPPILYTGSVFTCDFGEAESDHGCWIVDLDNEGARTEFVPLEGRRFVTVDLDDEDVRQLAGEPHRPFDEEEATNVRHYMGRIVRDAVVRVRYQATEQQARRIDHQAMRDELQAAGAHHVAAIEPTIIREGAEASRLDGSFDDLEPRVAARSWLEAHVEDPDERAAAAAAADGYLEATA